MADKKSNPRLEDEDWVVEHPDPKKIQCATCTKREADRKVGSTTIEGCTLGICKEFGIKPYKVLFKGAKCPKFEAEKK